MVRAAGAFPVGRLGIDKPPLLNVPQGCTVVPALAASRQVAAPVVDAFACLPSQSTPDDPGAPFECLEPELAPVALFMWICRFD